MKSLFLSLALLLAAPVTALSAPACKAPRTFVMGAQGVATTPLPYSALMTSVRAEIAADPTTKLVEIVGGDAQKVTAFINAQPPVTDIKVDEFVVVEKRDPAGEGQFAVVNFVKDGCVFYVSAISWTGYINVIDGALGRGA